MQIVSYSRKLVLKKIMNLRKCICDVIYWISNLCILCCQKVQSCANYYADYRLVPDEEFQLENVSVETDKNMVVELKIRLDQSKRKIEIQEKEIADLVKRLDQSKQKIEILEKEKAELVIRYEGKVQVVTKENVELLTRLKECEGKIQILTKEKGEALTRLKDCEGKIQILTKEKGEALTRLSELMGQKLRDNNPAITNLNDPNRPMKLGEQFSELYENEWTDAYSAISESKNLSLTEKETIDILLNILKEIYQICYEESVKQIEAQKAKLTDFKDDDVKVKELVKNNAAEDVPVLCKKILQYGSTRSDVFQYRDYAVPYIERCVQICYLAVVHDPPMYMEFEPNKIFDKQFFKEYTKSGSTVDFIVWPALFLYKGGPILGKGVVQPKDTG